MMEGFTRDTFHVNGVDIVLRHGGSGPPLLLMHGNPFTHLSWNRVAPELARRFTVVTPDLRGYGDSSKPDGGKDHYAYSFREMGKDMVEPTSPSSTMSTGAANERNPPLGGLSVGSGGSSQPQAMSNPRTRSRRC